MKIKREDPNTITTIDNLIAGVESYSTHMNKDKKTIEDAAKELEE